MPVQHRQSCCSMAEEAFPAWPLSWSAHGWAFCAMRVRLGILVIVVEVHWKAAWVLHSLMWTERVCRVDDRVQLQEESVHQYAAWAASSCPVACPPVSPNNTCRIHYCSSTMLEMQPAEHWTSLASRLGVSVWRVASSECGWSPND